jgi:hypothetical protein
VRSHKKATQYESKKATWRGAASKVSLGMCDNAKILEALWSAGEPPFGMLHLMMARPVFMRPARASMVARGLDQ